MMNMPCKIQCPECGLWLYGIWGKPGEIRKDSQCPRGFGLARVSKCGRAWNAKLIKAFDKPNQF